MLFSVPVAMEIMIWFMLGKLGKPAPDYQITKEQLAGIEIVAVHCMSQFFGHRQIDTQQMTEDKLKKICETNIIRHAIVNSYLSEAVGCFLEIAHRNTL